MAPRATLGLAGGQVHQDARRAGRCRPGASAKRRARRRRRRRRRHGVGRRRPLLLLRSSSDEATTARRSCRSAPSTPGPAPRASMSRSSSRTLHADARVLPAFIARGVHVHEQVAGRTFRPRRTPPAAVRLPRAPAPARPPGPGPTRAPRGPGAADAHRLLRALARAQRRASDGPGAPELGLWFFIVRWSRRLYSARSPRVVLL